MNVSLKQLLFALCLLCFSSFRAAAISYIPPVSNYSVNEYKAGNQNWAAAQGQNGWMFFGNNRGLLVYDGARWQLQLLPNKNAARSIYVAADGRIYVGSFEEFGFFEIDDRGLFSYTSLRDSVSDYTFRNDEIWTISNYQGKIYFQSFGSFFIYDGDRVEKGVSENSPLYFFSSNGELYAQFLHEGFFRSNAQGFEKLISRDELNNDNVVGVLAYRDGLLLATAMNGLFLYSKGKVTPWKTNAGEWLKNKIANRAVMMNDSMYVVGTISNGLIAFDKEGNINWKVNRENRLINNTVLGLFADSANNLWVALDNGIAQIQASSFIRYADFSGMDFGMVNDMAVKNGNFYLATNQGLYAVSESEGLPRVIPGSEEQTWYVSNEENRLFVGHNKGTLMIENGKANRLLGERGGGTAIRKCLIHGKEILLQASYSILTVFVKGKNGEWEYSHDVEGFSNLIKSFEVDFAGTIWASHMHKGLCRLELDNSLRHVREQEYISRLTPDAPEGIINVMKLRGRIVFTDGQRFYTYEDMSRKIIPYDWMNRHYPHLASSYRIVMYDNDQYWFVSNVEFALMAYEEGNLMVQARIPFSEFDNPPIENRGNVFVDKNGVTYFCLNGGFAVFSYEMMKTETDRMPLYLGSVKASTRDNKDSRNLRLQPDKPAEINYAYNNILFEFSYPNFNEYGSKINYKLEGFEGEWGETVSEFTKPYFNLPYGSYVLHAKVTDAKGEESSALSFSFIIKPPFYKSVYAYILYTALLAAALILLIRNYVSQKLKREKKIAAKRHRQQQELLMSQEQLITKLEKEKLEGELTFKSKELASATLSVISQNEFLEQLKAEVQAQKLSGSYSKTFFDKLIRMINDNITKGGDWTVFQANFDRIHENFFAKLKDRYPDLTSGDLRMCALLRLNMPTKDMAGMLNLSVRGVEAARYRLRKKLNLAEGESLTNFVITFE